MLDVFEHFGVHAEELGPHNFQLNPQGVITDAFPSLPDEGLIATFERSHALSREDVTFLSWDHPMVTGSIDLLLSGEKGNSTFGCWPSPEDKTILLECNFILEAIADSKLHVDRFLPPTPVRILVNHKGTDVTAQISSTDLGKRLEKANPHRLIDSPNVSRQVIPAAMQAATQSAEEQAAKTIADSLHETTHLLGHEISRLETLAKVNDHIRPEEINLLTEQSDQLKAAIQSARLRLDSMRLIWKGDPAALQ